MADPWITLAERVTAAERQHRRRAEDLWRSGDILAAATYRAKADGLEMARELHLQVTAEVRGPKPASSDPFGAVVDPCAGCGCAKAWHGPNGCTGDFTYCPCATWAPIDPQPSDAGSPSPEVDRG